MSARGFEEQREGQMVRVRGTHAGEACRGHYVVVSSVMHGPKQGVMRHVWHALMGIEACALVAQTEGEQHWQEVLRSSERGRW
jgi:hypothetical protein